MRGTLPSDRPKVNSGTSYFPQWTGGRLAKCAERPYRGSVGEFRRAVLLALALAVVAAWPAHAAEVLPDIDMRAPSNVQLTTNGGQSFVAFTSRVESRGPGILKLLGQRSDTSQDTMSVTQVLLDGISVDSAKVARTVPDVGRMQFSPAGGHNHWHFLRFEDYMLLSVPDLNFVAPTRKTGFCLVGLNVGFGCGSNDTTRLQIGDPAEATVGSGPFPATQAMGLLSGTAPGSDFNGNRSSVDVYQPTVEGQDIEITGIPNGRYCLSFVVNPEDRILETTTADNGASTLIDVGGTPGGTRTLAVGETFESSGTCGLTKPGTTDPGTVDPGSSPPPEQAPPSDQTPPTVQTPPAVQTPPTDQTPAPRTPRPPLLTMRKAAQLARTALSQKFRSPRRLSRACRLIGAQHASCRVAFVQSGTRYRGNVGIKQLNRAGEWRWFYAIDVKRTAGTTCGSCPQRVRTKTLLGGVLGVNRAAALRALSLPVGRPAAEKPGTAWPTARLYCPLVREQLAQRKQVG
jgi:hypothetical protein